MNTPLCCQLVLAIIAVIVGIGSLVISLLPFVLENATVKELEESPLLESCKPCKFGYLQNDRRYCCNINEGILKEAAEKALSSNHDAGHTDPCAEFAHVPLQQTGYDITLHPTIGTCSNMNVTRDVIAIQDTGYYFVYSKISVTEPSRDVTMATKDVIHKIIRHHVLYAGGKETLFKGIRSKASVRGHQQGRGEVATESFLGGVFRLIKGTEIRLEVVNAGNICQNCHNDNYLGVMRID